jgi:cyclic pyranopterin phosphate synthase
MVDVSAKDVTVREATAVGAVRCSADVVAALRGEGVPKGDALAVARLAGIQAAKRTPELVPLAHPVAVHAVVVDVEVVDTGVEIPATVRTADRTGVEMEALTAVAVAGLAMVDMVKAIDSVHLANFEENSPYVRCSARSRTRLNVAASQKAVVPPLPSMTS